MSEKGPKYDISGVKIKEFPFKEKTMQQKICNIQFYIKF